VFVICEHYKRCRQGGIFNFYDFKLTKYGWFLLHLDPTLLIIHGAQCVHFVNF